MTDIDLTRSRLAYMALAALIVFGLMAFFFGEKLSTPQMVLLSNIVMLVGSEAKSAFAYLFDGIAGKKTPATDPPASSDPAAPGLDATPALPTTTGAKP